MTLAYPKRGLLVLLMALGLTQGKYAESGWDMGSAQVPSCQTESEVLGTGDGSLAVVGTKRTQLGSATPSVLCCLSP